MAGSVNKVILVGNLGADPEKRAMPSGSMMVNVSVATTDSWKDKQTGERRDRTEWHKVVFFDRLAEIVAQYLHKGSKVYIEGRLQTRKWQDKNGQDRWTTEIVANEMHMLDSKGGGTADFEPSPRSPSQSRPMERENAAPRQDNNWSNSSGGSADFDDDIPF